MAVNTRVFITQNNSVGHVVPKMNQHEATFSFPRMALPQTWLFTYAESGRLHREEAVRKVASRLMRGVDSGRRRSVGRSDTVGRTDRLSLSKGENAIPMKNRLVVSEPLRHYLLASSQPFP
jgi:hypothetical protein